MGLGEKADILRGGEVKIFDIMIVAHDYGDGYITVYIGQTSMKCTLKMGKFYSMQIILP